MKILFWITILLNSFLLFLVEPMFGRMIFPIAGGSMSSWNVALMAFQVLLLAGYTYSHYLPKLIGAKVFVKVHLILLVLSAIISFWLFTSKNISVNPTSPTWDVVKILLSTIGLSFFMLSTSSSNFQRWYSLTQKDNPYHLYALSNFGNLIALIGYGLVIEVLFGLKHQMFLWNLLYSLSVAIAVFIGFKVYRHLITIPGQTIEDPSHLPSTESITKRRRIYWVLLSFIPCSLMIATNSILDNTVNVNHIHYFWLIPLTLYLIAYIVAFSRLNLLNIEVYEKLALWCSMLVIFIVFAGLSNYIYILSLLALFFISLVCNMYVVKDAPKEVHLTEFYLYISIGGALGGVFSSILAPLIFNNIYEFPLMIMLFLLLLYHQHKHDSEDKFSIEPWEYTLLLTGGLGIFMLYGLSIQAVYAEIVLVLLFLMRRLLRFRKTRLLNLIIILITALVFNILFLRDNEKQVRNFYGVKTIVIEEHIGKDNLKYQLTHLLNGNTLHGTQFAKGSTFEYESLIYYDRTGSTAGRFFEANRAQILNVGIVGLGVASLSALSDQSQVWKYFEIDPQVIEIAQDDTYFTMLNHYKHAVISGDARITLQAEADHSFDVLVLDAYSGDIVPASLLTKEAVALYKSKVKPNGTLLFHISNRQFDLKPVLSKVAEVLELDCYIDTDRTEPNIISASSEWVIMTNNPEIVSKSWKEIDKYPKFALWTDDKYSLSSILIK